MHRSNRLGGTDRFSVAVILVFSVLAIGWGAKDPVTKLVNKGLAVYGEAIMKGQILPGK